MIQLVWFVFLFYLVYASSQTLNRQVFVLNRRISPRFNTVVYLYSLSLIPGTVIHELSHLFMATLLFVRVGSMNFVPIYRPQAGGLTLGTAQIAKTDFVRLSLIGLAPTLSGLASLYLISKYFIFNSFSPNQLLRLPELLNTKPWFVWLLIGYAVFTLTNTMHTSPSDRQAWPIVVITGLLFVLVNYFLGLVDLQPLLLHFPVQIAGLVNPPLLMALIVNLLVLFLIYFFRRLALRRI